MKLNIEFIQAKKSKNISALIIRRYAYKQKNTIELFINVKIPFTDQTQTVKVESETEIILNSFQKNAIGKDLNICFHCNYYEGNHIYTFLEMIKKDSNVKFEVVAFNSCDTWDNLNLVGHRLYGIIDKKRFLLCEYVGLNNSASPIQNI